MADVRVNDEVIQGENLVSDGTSYFLFHSLPIETSEKQINIVVNLFDTAIYSAVTLRFKVKGDGKIEKIAPIFEEISEDKNLPKTSFLDKLTSSDIPLYKTSGKTANLVINMSTYECEFLCKEININGEKVMPIVEQTSDGIYCKRKHF